MSNFAELEHEKSLLKRKSAYLQRKLNNMDKLMDIDKHTELNLLRNEVEEFRQQIKSLESKNRALEQLVQILKNPVVTTFQDGKYANDVRECVMALLSLNVSIDKIDQVVKVILNKLAKKDIERLPSAGVKARLMQEALFLGQIQVGEAMLEDVSGDSGNRLHGDGTSKYHRHFQNF